MRGEVRVKGFVFSLDALFAVILAAVAVAAISGMILTSKTQAYGNMPLARAAQDTLTLMDKQGFLRSIFNMTDPQAQASIDGNFSSYVPVQMGGDINITICQYNDPGFNCTRSFYGSVKNESSGYVSSARRVFADPLRNQYGVAVVRMWYT